MLSLPLIIASMLQAMESNSAVGFTFCYQIKRLIHHSTRVLNGRAVGCYLLFSCLELKLLMIVFHTGFLSGHNIDLFSFFFFKRIKNIKWLLYKQEV
jgi:hypothetical protein